MLEVMAKPPTLTHKQRFIAVAKVAKITATVAPGVIFIQIFNSLFRALLPIATAFFAGLTTTSLVQAAQGDDAAVQSVILYIGITAVLGILSTMWSTIEGYVDQVLRYKIDAAVSDQMFEHFMTLDFWRYDDKDTIDTYEKASQFARFFPYVFGRVADIASQFIAMVAGLVAMLFVSWWLGLILLVAVIPGLIIQLKLSRLQMNHWRTNVDTRRTISNIEWRMLQPSNMAELRLYNMARYLIDLRAKLRDKDDKVRINFEKQFVAKRIWANVLESTAEVIALIWTAIQIINQGLPIGYFLYVQQVVSRVLGGASQLVGIFNTIDEDLANLVEYQKFMDMPSGGKGTKRIRGGMGELTVEHVSFHYPHAEAKVLEDVSFTVKRGQHIAIVGENGAGKSTLIKILTGLYAPVEGQVLIDDVPLQDYQPESWHRQLAFLSQQYLSFTFANAKDNVVYGDASHPFDQERFDHAIDRAEARTFLEKLPNGINNYVSPWMEDDDGNQGVDLSGGQWQRLALARNFYRDSPVIILDEPTSAIDALAESRIFKHLFALKDKTIITVSHRLTTVKKADLIYMMQDGKIVEHGTYAELVKKQGAFYTMFESQM